MLFLPSLPMVAICVPFSSIRLNSLKFRECAKWSRFSSISARSLTLLLRFFHAGKERCALELTRGELCLTWAHSHKCVAHTCAIQHGMDVCGVGGASKSLTG